MNRSVILLFALLITMSTAFAISDDGYFVATGQLGRIWTSPEGINWTLAPTTVGSVDVFAIAWNPKGEYWIAAGQNGIIGISNNGTHWNHTTYGTANWHGAYYQPDTGYTFVGGASGNYIIFDDTGTNITPVTTHSAATHWQSTGAYCDGKHAFSATGGLYVSENGTNWTYLSHPSGDASRNVYCLATGDFLITRRGANLAGWMVTNGTSLSSYTSISSHTHVGGVVHESTNAWIIAGWASYMRVSLDNGTTWTERSVTGTGSIEGCGYSPELDMSVCVGDNRRAAHTYDGWNWTSQGNGALSGGSGHARRVAWGGIPIPSPEPSMGSLSFSADDEYGDYFKGSFTISATLENFDNATCERTENGGDSWSSGSVSVNDTHVSYTDAPTGDTTINASLRCKENDGDWITTDFVERTHDGTPPSISFSPASDSSEDNITVTINTTDSGSGVNESTIEYCVTTGASCTPSASGSSVFINQTGSWTVCAYAEDHLGNNDTVCSAEGAYTLSEPEVSDPVPDPINITDIVLYVEYTTFTLLDGVNWSVGYLPLNATNVSVFVDFGDDTNSSSFSGEKFYNATGEYVITATITDWADNTLSDNVTVTVVSDPVQPVTVNVNFLEPELIIFILFIILLLFLAVMVHAGFYVLAGIVLVVSNLFISLQPLMVMFSMVVGVLLMLVGFVMMLRK